MSQRLAVGKPPEHENIYDCVITEQSTNNLDKLKSEWLSWKSGWYLGPWKISVFDVDLFKFIEPVLIELLKSIDRQYPQDVWVIYYKQKHIEHPSINDLHNFLYSPTKHGA